MLKAVLFLWNEYLIKSQNDNIRNVTKNVLSYLTVNYGFSFANLSATIESSTDHFLWRSESIQFQLILKPNYKIVTSEIRKTLLMKNVAELHVIYIGVTISGYSAMWLFPDGIISCSTFDLLISKINKEISQHCVKNIWLHMNENRKTWSDFALRCSNDKDCRIYINVNFVADKCVPGKENLEFISNVGELIVNNMNTNYTQFPIENPVLVNNIKSNPSQIGIFLSKDFLGNSSLLSVGGFNMIIDCPNLASTKCYNYFKNFPKTDAFLITSWNAYNTLALYNMTLQHQIIPMTYFILPQTNIKGLTKPLEISDLFILDIRTMIKDIMASVKGSGNSTLQPLADVKKNFKLFYKLGSGTLQMFCIFPPIKDLFKPLKFFYDAFDNYKENSSLEKLICDTSLACILTWRSDEKHRTIRILISGSCHETVLIKYLALFSKTDSLFNSFNDNKLSDCRDNKCFVKSKTVEVDKTLFTKDIVQSPHKTFIRAISENIKTTKKSPIFSRYGNFERQKSAGNPKLISTSKSKKPVVDDFNKMNVIKPERKTSKCDVEIKLLESESKDISLDNITNEDTLTNIGSMEILGGFEDFIYVAEPDYQSENITDLIVDKRLEKIEHREIDKYFEIGRKSMDNGIGSHFNNQILGSYEEANNNLFKEIRDCEHFTHKFEENIFEKNGEFVINNIVENDLIETGPLSNIKVCDKQEMVANDGERWDNNKKLEILEKELVKDKDHTKKEVRERIENDNDTQNFKRELSENKEGFCKSVCNLQSNKVKSKASFNQQSFEKENWSENEDVEIRKYIDVNNERQCFVSGNICRKNLFKVETEFRQDQITNQKVNEPVFGQTKEHKLNIPKNVDYEEEAKNNSSVENCFSSELKNIFDDNQSVVDFVKLKACENVQLLNTENVKSTKFNFGNENISGILKDKTTHWSEPTGLPFPVISEPIEEFQLLSDNSSTTHHKKSLNYLSPRKSAGKSLEGTSNRINITISRQKEIIENIQGYYIDIVYIPMGIVGNVESSRVSEKFFLKVRAFCYVFPGVEHNPKILNSIILGKNKWNNKDKQKRTHIILVNDSDECREWILENETKLSELKIIFKVVTGTEMFNICKYIYPTK